MQLRGTALAQHEQALRFNPQHNTKQLFFEEKVKEPNARGSQL
jgi:hypothetical protein